MIRALDVTDGPGIKKLAEDVEIVHVLFNCAGLVFAFFNISMRLKV